MTPYEELTPYLLYKAHDRMARIRLECQHSIQEDGPNAKIELVETGTGTATGWKYFVKGEQGSPLGRILSVGEDDVTVQYYSAEILNFLEKHFKS